MTNVITQALQYTIMEKISKAACLNSCVFSHFRRLQNDSDDADVTARLLFQTRAAASGKTRSAMVDSRLRLTVSVDDEPE